MADGGGSLRAAVVADLACTTPYFAQDRKIQHGRARVREPILAQDASAWVVGPATAARPPWPATTKVWVATLAQVCSRVANSRWHATVVVEPSRVGLGLKSQAEPALKSRAEPAMKIRAELASRSRVELGTSHGPIHLIAW
jgi:hypothetical protein